MEIYLIRHSEAVELNNEIVDDSFRYLSNSGRQKTIEVANKLKEMKVHFDCILTSPVIRAVQTAELLAASIHHKGEIITAIELMGGSSFTRFMQLINRNSRFKKVACVGHAPDVNNYAVALASKKASSEVKINFKNTSVCKISFDTKKNVGRIDWFLKSDSMELLTF